MVNSLDDSKIIELFYEHSEHKSTVILIELRWTFSMPENRLK